MASGYQGDGAGQSLPHQESEIPPVETGDQNRQLLEQVLEATLELGNDEPLQEEELRSLVSAARRRKNEPLTADTVMELVQAALRLRYRELIGARATWDKMTRQIAETIFEDPATRAKMELLWTRLCEAAQ